MPRICPHCKKTFYYSGHVCKASSSDSEEPAIQTMNDLIEAIEKERQHRIIMFFINAGAFPRSPVEILVFLYRE